MLFTLPNATLLKCRAPSPKRPSVSSKLFSMNSLKWLFVPQILKSTTSISSKSILSHLSTSTKRKSWIHWLTEKSNPKSPSLTVLKPNTSIQPFFTINGINALEFYKLMNWHHWKIGGKKLIKQPCKTVWFRTTVKWTQRKLMKFFLLKNLARSTDRISLWLQTSTTTFSWKNTSKGNKSVT